MMGALFFEPRLNSIKQRAVQNNWLLTGEYLSLELNLANIKSVTQEMGEWASSEWNPANRAARG